MEFSDYALTAFLLRLLYACLAMAGLVYFSAWLDRRCGNRFATLMEAMRGNPLALAVYLAARILALALLMGALMGCASAHAAPLTTNSYDRQIQRSVERWWPAYPDWLMWKAQLYQESRFEPAAVSPVGARGLAQFMPGTWREVAGDLRLGPASPHDEIAIDAGAYYMAKMRRIWTGDRPEIERHRLAQASYNAGAGNILRAQRLCGGMVWVDIAPCLPRVTGPRNAAETQGYVERIARWRMQLAAGGR